MTNGKACGAKGPLQLRRMKEWPALRPLQAVLDGIGMVATYDLLTSQHLIPNGASALTSPTPSNTSSGATTSARPPANRHAVQ